MGRKGSKKTKFDRAKYDEKSKAMREQEDQRIQWVENPHYKSKAKENPLYRLPLRELKQQIEDTGHSQQGKTVIMLDDFREAMTGGAYGQDDLHQIAGAFYGEDNIKQPGDINPSLLNQKQLELFEELAGLRDGVLTNRSMRVPNESEQDREAWKASVSDLDLVMLTMAIEPDDQGGTVELLTDSRRFDRLLDKYRKDRKITPKNLSPISQTRHMMRDIGKQLDIMQPGDVGIEEDTTLHQYNEALLGYSFWRQCQLSKDLQKSLEKYDPEQDDRGLTGDALPLRYGHKYISGAGLNSSKQEFIEQEQDRLRDLEKEQRKQKRTRDR